MLPFSSKKFELSAFHNAYHLRKYKGFYIPPNSQAFVMDVTACCSSAYTTSDLFFLLIFVHFLVEVLHIWTIILSVRLEAFFALTFRL